MLLVVAVAIRVSVAGAPPLEFAAMRQYHSALIARALFLDRHPDAAPAWQRETADAYVAQATIPEPLIVERIAASAYALTGGERLWLARALSLIYWCVGAWCLHGAGRRLAGPTGGLTALAAILFLPYSLDASLSFQPDGLAVMFMCGALWAFARADDESSGGAGLWIAIGMAMAATFVRPMAACFLLPVLAVVLWRQASLGPRTRAVRIAAGAAFIVGPAVLYAAGRWIADPYFAARVGATFVPGLLVTPSFWRGWAGLAVRAFGWTLPVGAIGAAVVARGRMRAWLLSLWAGYALYGIAFDLHISTHPYYETLAVPLVALSLAPIAARIAGAGARWRPLAVPTGTAALLLLGAVLLGRLPVSADAPGRLAAIIQDMQSLGQTVGHSRRTIFLASDWGVPLRYYAGIAGRYWPATFEIDMYRPLGAGGIPNLDAGARLRRFGGELGGVDFFIVVDRNEFARQPDLQGLLKDRPRLPATSSIQVFDSEVDEAGPLSSVRARAAPRAVL